MEKNDFIKIKNVCSAKGSIKKKGKKKLLRENICKSHIKEGLVFRIY